MKTECKDHGACPSVALSQAEIDKGLSSIDLAWKLESKDPKKISREFKFKNFSQALEFVNKVGVIAETMNHHPDISLKWGSARIEYWTHNANGLTQMDFQAAAKIDKQIENTDSNKPLWILIAGPYRSGTNDDPKLLAKNVDDMNKAALEIFRAGHMPILGEWFALPLVKEAGSKAIGDEIFNEIFHPIAIQLGERLDACLRIGGASQGADEMVRLAKERGQKVFYSIDEVPAR